MSTKLYFRSTLASSILSGTLPSGEQSSGSADASAVADSGGAISIPRMLEDASATANYRHTLTSLASAASKKYLMGLWCSRPLAGGQSIGAANIIISTMIDESNLNANFKINLMNIYIWRPSTGAKVGTVVDMPGGIGPISAAAEPGATGAAYCSLTTLSSGVTAIAVNEGDIICIELWAQLSQSSATAYTDTLYLNGIVESSVNGEYKSASSFAGYVTFSETINFSTGVIESGAAVVAATGTLTAAGQYILQGAAAFAAVAELDAASLNYVDGVAAFSAALGGGAEGTGINEAVASFAASGVLSGVWDMSSVVAQGVATFEALGALTAIGVQYYPHIFAQESAAGDGWSKETSL